MALSIAAFNQSQYSPLVTQAANANGIPVPIFQSLVKTESNFDPYAVSSSGALGLAQLMPGTAQALGANPFDPASNLQGGASYLASMFKKFGNWADALSAYNAGPGNVGSTQGQTYAQKVLSGAGLGTGENSQGGTNVFGPGAVGGVPGNIPEGGLPGDFLGAPQPAASGAAGNSESWADWLKTWGLNGLLIVGAVVLGLIGVYIAATRE